MTIALTHNDCAAKKGVEIQIRHDGLVIWVNVDGVCVARILTTGLIPIVVEDNREQNGPAQSKTG